MNRLLSGMAAVAFAAGLWWTAGAAWATVYAGPGTGDGTVANDGGAISSVDVTNDANNISFTINSTQNMQSYIFFEVELQITGQAGSGDKSLTNNPYTAPNVGISTGVNSLIDTYGSGFDTYTWSGAWNHTDDAAFAAGGTGNTFATITVPLSYLDLSVGNSFLFDVVSSYTNPTGQSAYSALDSTGYPAETDNSYKPYLGTNDYDSATDASSTFNSAASLYIVTAVPEPATIGLVALSSLGLMARRNKKN